MFTLALAARATSTSSSASRAGSPSSARSSPSRSSCPRTAPRSRSRAPGATSAPSRCRHLRRRDRARQPGGGPACLTRPAAGRPHDAPARRARPGLGPCDDRGRARRRRSRPPTRPASRSSCWPAAATSSSPTTGFPGTVVEVATTGVSADDEDDRPHLRRRARSPSPPASRGTPSWPRAVDSGWVGVEALSGIPGSVGRDPDPERRRLRPGGVPDRGVGPRLGPPAARLRTFAGRRLRLRLPHQPVQGRPRHATSSSASTFQFRAGRPRCAGRLRRAGPHPRRRAGRSAPR